MPGTVQVANGADGGAELHARVCQEAAVTFVPQLVRGAWASLPAACGTCAVLMP